jgi:hypothetical protein
MDIAQLRRLIHGAERGNLGMAAALYPSSPHLACRIVSLGETKGLVVQVQAGQQKNICE